MSAMEDYLQLIEKGSPLRAQWDYLKHTVKRGLENTIPSTTDLMDPQKAAEMGLNMTPATHMLGTIRPSRIKDVLASLEAKGYDTSTPWYHGSSGLVKDWGAPSFFTSDKNAAQAFINMRGAGSKEYPSGVLNKVFLPRQGALDVRKDWGQGNPSLIKHLENAGVSDALANPNYGKDIPGYMEHSLFHSDNLNDATYIPAFQQYLQGKGYNSLRNLDELGKSDIDTRIMIDPAKIYNITTKRISMPQYQRRKIPSSILEKLRK